jgi:hypothetical protein
MPQFALPPESDGQEPQLVGDKLRVDNEAVLKMFDGVAATLVQ